MADAKTICSVYVLKYLKNDRLYCIIDISFFGYVFFYGGIKMSGMYIKAVNTVKKYNMLFKGAKVVTGVSGGADSTALLLFLCSLRESYNLEIYAVHVHHGIRGDEADRDMRFVENLCKKLNVDCTVKHHEVKGISKEKGISEEEAGRMVRYSDFREELEKRGADFIAVAHNMNDQAETVIMRLCRGTGLTGMAGIRPVRVNIIRPLIDCFRSEIEEYLEFNNQEYINDSTNFKEDYTRNRIRLNVIPYLSSQINSGAMENIAKSAVLLREEDDYLNSLALKKLKEITVKKEKNAISLNAVKLCEVDKVLQRRIIRLGLIMLKKDIKDISLNHVDSVLKTAQKGGHTDMPSGFCADTSCGILKLREGKAQVQDFSYKLELDKPVFVEECGMYFLMTKNDKKINEKPNNVYTKVFDCDKISINPEIRNRRNGDKIIINKNGGTKKLKDIFIDKKIPKDERDIIAVIVSGNDIMSVWGIRDSAYFLPESRGKNELFIHAWRKNYD